MSTYTAGTRHSSPDFGPNDLRKVLAQSWWLVALRGALAVVFGLIALFMPVVTILAIVVLFSAYMIVDGLFSITVAVWAAQQRERWGLLALQGAVSIATGIIVFVWSELTVVAFVLILAAWAIVSGCLLVAAAARVDWQHGSLWFGLAGVASVAYGVLMIIAPMVGAVVLTWWLGAFALVLGVALLILAFRLRAHRADHPISAAGAAT
jgi:uncharacterized membrane protein HdeD (DUF308 family)